MSERLHVSQHDQQPQQDDAVETDAMHGLGASNSSVAAEAEQARAGVQAKEGGFDGNAAGVHDIAASGVQGSSEALPHAAAIQRSFGKYDVGNIRAHTGDQAENATSKLGATAFAKGNDIAFGKSPDLHTAAHEATHVIQQRAGVQLKGGVGKEGDAYERHADAVADRVVQGKSSEALLSKMAGPEAATGDAALQLMLDDAVQFLGKPLDENLGEGDAKPAHGEDKGEQRRYSVEQYITMWEKEQGREMTAREKKTLARGCIGITALNLTGGGNPPLNHAFASFSDAHASMTNMNAALDGLRSKPETAGQAAGKNAVVFAKLFWSNQNPDSEKRKKPDKDAYKPDDKGKVDMTDYKYRAQPGYINFDYGFWDDSTKCFWHANHSMPGMKVYQSTLDKFSAGYMDFDRVIFCVGIAENYDPGLAALATVGGN